MVTKEESLISGFVRTSYQFALLPAEIVLLQITRLGLSHDEIDELANLLKSNDKDIVNDEWKLIFQSKKDGIERGKFVESVHDKQHILIFIIFNIIF